MPEPAARPPGRPRDEARRTELATRVADVLIARGSCEVPLRELADALGISSRMLVHHLGSRDAAIAAGLQDARGRLLLRARSQLAELAPTDLRTLVRAVRAVVIDPGSRGLFALFSEVNALSRTQPERFPGFGRASVSDWLPQFAELVGDPPGDEARATLALGIVRGLMLDLSATGDEARVDAAFALLDGLLADV